VRHCAADNQPEHALAAAQPAALAAGGLFTLSLIFIGERFRDEALVRANATLALLWGIGCLLGPLSTGGASQWLSSHALPMLMATGAAVFLYLAFRSVAKAI